MFRQWLWGQFKILLSLAVYVAGGLTVFFTLTWVAAVLAPPGQQLSHAFLEAFVLNLLSWFIGLVVHEGGHYFAAVRNGGYIAEIRISCFYLIRRRHGYRLQIKRPPSFLGGWVRQYPNPASDIRSHMILVLLAGAGANVLFAVMAGCLSLASYMADSPISAAIFGSLAWVNLFMGISNLVPSWRSANKDGSKLYRWLVGKGLNTTERVTMKLAGMSWSGIRVRDIPQTDIQILTDDPTPAMKLYAGLFRMRGAMDSGDVAGALTIFTQHRDLFASLSAENQKILKNHWQWLALESGYLQARFHKDASQARLELARLNPDLPRYMTMRVEAAAEYAEGHFEQARIAITKAREDIEDSPDAGTRIEELAMLDDLEARLTR